MICSREYRGTVENEVFMEQTAIILILSTIIIFWCILFSQNKFIHSLDKHVFVIFFSKNIQAFFCSSNIGQENKVDG